MKSVNEIADEYEGTTSWISIAFLYISVAVRSATAGASCYTTHRSVYSGGLAPKFARICSPIMGSISSSCCHQVAYRRLTYSVMQTVFHRD